jgi:ABC-type transport system involved in multi-copper enzyme maturation permease subunit
MIPAIVRLEIAGVRRARWFVAALALAGGLVGFFVLVATRESAVIGFTGFGRVMGGVVQASLLFLPLLALASTTQAVTSARQTGVLEWYLSYPNGRERCFWALFLPRCAAVIGPVAASVALLGLAAWGLGESVPPALLAAFLALLVGQGACFSALGIWVSALSRTTEQALLRGLLLWMAAVALVDFVVLGLLLRWELPPAAIFALAGLNPVQAGRIGILAAIDPELGVLGPVGTWAVTTLGTGATIAWGLTWPFLLGGAALFGARRTFLRSDVL